MSPAGPTARCASAYGVEPLSNDPRCDATVRALDIGDYGGQAIVGATLFGAAEDCFGNETTPDISVQGAQQTGLRPWQSLGQRGFDDTQHDPQTKSGQRRRTTDHAERAGGLPQHHADPFGRLLIAQAQLEDMPLMTADGRVSAYEVTIL